MSENYWRTRAVVAESALALAVDPGLLVGSYPDGNKRDTWKRRVKEYSLTMTELKSLQRVMQ